jgi:hypothetical protein
MAFVYCVGFNMIFYTYSTHRLGQIVLLEQLQLRQGGDSSPSAAAGGNSLISSLEVEMALTDTTHTDTRSLREYLHQAARTLAPTLTTPPMIGTALGIVIGIVPGLSK